MSFPRIVHSTAYIAVLFAVSPIINRLALTADSDHIASQSTTADDLLQPNEEGNQEPPRSPKKAIPKVIVPESVPCHLVGQVQRPDGSVAAGARVTAISFGFGATRHSVLADDRGEFEMTLSGDPDTTARWWLLALLGDDSGSIRVSFTIPVRNQNKTPTVEQDPQVVVIQMSTGRAISGTVFHESTRKPVPLARIYSHQGQFVRTNRQGQFEMRGVTADVEQLFVSAPGMTQTRVFIDLSERPRAEIDVFLTPGGTVQGRVLDQKGNPVPGAIVSRSIGSMILGPLFMEKSDNDGRFAFEGFPVKTLMYPLFISAHGYTATESEMFAVRGTNQPAEITLGVTAVAENNGPAGLRHGLAAVEAPSLGAIRGRVVDALGSPVRNFMVRLLSVTQNEPRDSGSFSSRDRHFSDDDGRFVIGRLDADKRYRLAVIAPGFGRKMIEPIYAHKGTMLTDRDEVEFRLGPPHQLQIRVIDSETKIPIPDVMVGLLENRERREPFEWNYALTGASLEWTSASGIASFVGLSADEAPIFIEHPGYARFQTDWNENLNPPKAIDGDQLEIELVKESKLQIRIANLGDRNFRGLHMIATTATKQQFFSPMAVRRDTPTIEMRQLPAGKLSLILHDANAPEPWTPLSTFEVDLKSGDNEMDVDLSQFSK